MLTGKPSWLPMAGSTGVSGKYLWSASATILMVWRLEARDWRQMSCAGRSPVTRTRSRSGCVSRMWASVASSVQGGVSQVYSPHRPAPAPAPALAWPGEQHSG